MLKMAIFFSIKSLEALSSSVIGQQFTKALNFSSPSNIGYYIMHFHKNKGLWSKLSCKKLLKGETPAVFWPFGHIVLNLAMIFSHNIMKG